MGMGSGAFEIRLIANGPADVARRARPCVTAFIGPFAVDAIAGL